MYGIYINCRKYPFVDWMLSGIKTDETRTRDVLKRLVGERVYLIETGGKTPMVRGVATIASSRRVTYSELTARKSAGIIGTSYDIKSDSTKIFYRLENVERVQPFPVPQDHINHGRSYTEF